MDLLKELKLTTIKGRLKYLKDCNYTVMHKAIGKVELDEYDLIRVRQVSKGEVLEIKFGQVKGYHDFVHAERVNKDDYTQGIDEDILNKEEYKENGYLTVEAMTLKRDKFKYRQLYDFEDKSKGDI